MSKRSVLVVCFNRPEYARRLFEAVRRARPDFLYIAADGPRPDQPGEQELCAEVRDVFENVDWPCHVVRDFEHTNVGCKQRIISAYDRVFQEVDRAIILEEDVIVGSEFFDFCDTMLDRYTDTPRIRSVSGCSHVRTSRFSRSSYYFSRYPEMWGWATFRRSMVNVDWDPDPQATADKLRSLIRRRDEPERWRELLSMVRDGSISTWDYQYILAGIIDNRLSVVPRVPLTRNGGMGADSTHQGYADPFFTRPIDLLGTPIEHPKNVSRSVLFDQLRSLGALPPKGHLYAVARPYGQEIRRRVLDEKGDRLGRPSQETPHNPAMQETA